MLLFVIGVGLFSFPNPVQKWYALTQLNNHEKIWDSKNIVSYQFQVESMSMGYESIENIQIKNKLITSEIFIPPAKGATRPDYFDNLNTLNRVFDDARDSLQNANGLDLFTIKYDKTMGYPIEILYQSINPLIMDANSIIRISDFRIGQ